VRRQCELAGLSRSSHYYTPMGESEQNLEYMRLIDEQYLMTPFYGSPRMTQMLRQKGHPVNKKRVERLMCQMGIQAVRPKRNLSQRAEGHKVYPYLLRGLKVERPNQVWATDIPYIRMQKGFLYLCAVMDWHSRYVLSWRLSNSLDAGFCVDAQEEALGLGFCLEIFHSDQGRQFTSAQFTGILLDYGVKISMDGCGRALDNVFVERLLEKRQVRACLPPRVRKRGRAMGWVEWVLAVLQRGEAPSRPWLQNPKRSFSPKNLLPCHRSSKMKPIFVFPLKSPTSLREGGLLPSSVLKNLSHFSDNFLSPTAA
jgi:putative transposase